MSGVQTLEVKNADDGIRLDRWFKRHFPELSHGRLEKLLRTGQVRVDGSRAKSNLRLEEGQSIRVPPLPADTRPARRQPEQADPKEIADLISRIIHRDDDLIVIDKPPGLAVQGGSKVNKHIDLMLDGLRFGADERPKLVHRLDKDTSGVLLIARSARAANKLTEAFRSKVVRKIYWALVAGTPRPPGGIINLAIDKRLGAGGEQMEVVPDGKPAVTYFRTVDVASEMAAWVSLEPETGRTHQLRVHCAAIGNPIVGDGKYGGEAASIGLDGDGDRKMHLHARAIRIPHPAGGIVDIYADLPPHMVETWKFFGFQPRDDGAAFDSFDEARGINFDV